MFHPFGRWFSPSRRRLARPAPKPRTRLFLEPLEGRVVPTQFMVTALTDTGAGANNQGDLLYCMKQLDSIGDNTSNEIQFANGLTGTITLNTELPAIAKPVGIDGPGSSVITVARDSTAAAFRIFTVNSGITVGI